MIPKYTISLFSWFVKIDHSFLLIFSFQSIDKSYYKIITWHTGSTSEHILQKKLILRIKICLAVDMNEALFAWLFRYLLRILWRKISGLYDFHTMNKKYQVWLGIVSPDKWNIHEHNNEEDDIDKYLLWGNFFHLPSLQAAFNIPWDCNSDLQELYSIMTQNTAQAQRRIISRWVNNFFQ